MIHTLCSPFLTWISSTGNQYAPLGYPAKQVEPKQTDRRRSYFREWKDLPARCKPEMVLPTLEARMEERNYLPVLKTDAGNVGSLPGIASDAGECEVAEGGIAAVLSTNNVIDLMRSKRIVFMEQTVFATAGRPFAYQHAHGGGYFAGHAIEPIPSSEALGLSRLGSRLGHDHEMLEAKVLFELLILGSGDLSLAAARDQFTYPSLRVL